METKVIQTEKKDPVLAAVISFFVAGMGSVYAGQTRKGLTIFATAVVLGLLGMAVSPLFLAMALIVDIVGIAIGYDDASRATVPTAEEAMVAAVAKIRADFLSQLNQLTMLRDTGILSAEEWDAHKTAMTYALSEMPLEHRVEFLAKFSVPYGTGFLTPDEVNRIQVQVRGGR